MDYNAKRTKSPSLLDPIVPSPTLPPKAETLRGRPNSSTRPRQTTNHDDKDHNLENDHIARPTSSSSTQSPSRIAATPQSESLDLSVPDAPAAPPPTLGGIVGGFMDRAIGRIVETLQGRCAAFLFLVWLIATCLTRLHNPEAPRTTILEEASRGPVLSPALNSHYIEIISDMAQANDSYNTVARYDAHQASIVADVHDDVNLYNIYTRELDQRLTVLFSTENLALQAPYNCSLLRSALGPARTELERLDSLGRLAQKKLGNFTLTDARLIQIRVKESMSVPDYEELHTVAGAMAAAVAYFKRFNFARPRQTFDNIYLAIEGCCNASSPENAYIKTCVGARIPDLKDWAEKLYRTQG